MTLCLEACPHCPGLFTNDESFECNIQDSHYFTSKVPELVHLYKLWQFKITLMLLDKARIKIKTVLVFGSLAERLFKHPVHSIKIEEFASGPVYFYYHPAYLTRIFPWVYNRKTPTRIAHSLSYYVSMYGNLLGCFLSFFDVLDDEVLLGECLKRIPQFYNPFHGELTIAQMVHHYQNQSNELIN